MLLVVHSQILLMHDVNTEIHIADTGLLLEVLHPP